MLLRHDWLSKDQLVWEKQLYPISVNFITLFLKYHFITGENC